MAAKVRVTSARHRLYFIYRSPSSFFEFIVARLMSPSAGRQMPFHWHACLGVPLAVLPTYVYLVTRLILSQERYR